VNEKNAPSRDERELSSLMRASLAGEREAYSRLLQLIRGHVLPFVRNGLVRAGQGDSGSAEDVVQEVLLAIHSKRASYDPDQPFLPWMYAIARYKLIDYLRAARVRGQVDLVEDMTVFEQLAVSPADSASNVDSEALLGLLPKKQRTLIELVKLKGLSVQEAAIQTGFSASDVKVSIHRGIQALRKKLTRLR
jgi:RNA polymerase sigma-70 factor (ECF subfamily)